MRDMLAAAWVPDDDPARGWDAAVELAVRWTLARREEVQGEPVLVTNSFGVESSFPDLRAFLGVAHHVTPRSARVAGRFHAVLAYVPYGDALALAIRLAAGGTLAVVETVGFPVAGWARQVGAVDLTRGVVTEPFPAAVADALDRIMAYGNNGWTRGFGADRTLHVLAELRATGFDDVAAVVAAAAAAGTSAAAMQRLRHLAVKAGFAEDPADAGLI